MHLGLIDRLIAVEKNHMSFRKKNCLCKFNITLEDLCPQRSSLSAKQHITWQRFTGTMD